MFFYLLYQKVFVRLSCKDYQRIVLNTKFIGNIKLLNKGVVLSLISYRSNTLGGLCKPREGNALFIFNS